MADHPEMADPPALNLDPTPTAEELDLLVTMVRHCSPSRHEQAVNRYLVEAMARLGFDAALDRAGNAVGALGPGPREIVLLGHSDTVRGEIPVRLEDGVLHGRGAVDAKGPLATFVAAAGRARDALARQGKRVVVVGAVEEECRTSKGAKYALRRPEPEACVIGEPSGWGAVTLGYKGRLLLHFTVRQPMHHGASGEPTACEEALRLWRTVEEFARAYNEGKSQWEGLHASLLQVTSRANGLSDQARLTIGFRFPPALGLEVVDDLVRKAGVVGEVRKEGAMEPVLASKATPLVRAFLQAIRESGGGPKFKVKTGTSDMNLVARRWRCPLVAYGPGDSTLDHTPREHLSVDEYGRAIAVLARALTLL